jgi:hypothetical protein
MNCFDDAIDYIESEEKTDTSFVKIFTNSKNLVVSFNGNAHKGFGRKTSLMDLKYNKRYDIDVLYMRNYFGWYLNSMQNIGEKIDNTIEFLKDIFNSYERVVCTGSSAGGYASLLFGSLCNVNSVIAFVPQTNLDYIADKCQTKLLLKSKSEMTDWNNYSNISNILNSDVNYYFKFNNKYWRKVADENQNENLFILHDENIHFPTSIKNHPKVSICDDFFVTLNKTLSID